MYEWLQRSGRADDPGEHQRQDQDVWAWTVIGLVAAGTMLIVWVPLLIAALHS